MSLLKKDNIIVSISADELKKIENNNLLVLMEDDPLWYEKTKIHFIDVRSPDEYTKEHIKRSMSLPLDKINRHIQPEGISLVIFSSKDKTSEAKQVAEYIYNKNRELNRIEKVGKIYLVKDGFESLKNSGLPIESGFFD